MKPITLFLFFFFHFHFSGFTQNDPSDDFRKAKGKLVDPVSRFYKVIDSRTIFPGVGYVCWSPGNSYFIKEVDTVRAIWPGKVVTVFEMDGQYTIMARYGDYYICYGGLPETTITKGDSIRKGDCLAVLHPVNGNDSVIDLIIMKGSEELDPLEWIVYRNRQ